MFERFSKAARQVVILAQEEARRVGHRHIGTEHLLLGLLSAGEGTGARALTENDADIERLRESVARLVPSPPPRGSWLGIRKARTHIPFTKRAKTSLERSLHTARALGHDSIGTGHLLLGVLGAEGGTASRALADTGVDTGTLRTTAERSLRDETP